MWTLELEGCEFQLQHLTSLWLLLLNSLTKNGSQELREWTEETYVRRRAESGIEWAQEQLTTTTPSSSAAAAQCWGQWRTGWPGWTGGETLWPGVEGGKKESQNMVQARKAKQAHWEDYAEDGIWLHPASDLAGRWLMISGSWLPVHLPTRSQRASCGTGWSPGTVDTVRSVGMAKMLRRWSTVAWGWTWTLQLLKRHHKPEAAAPTL